jgi:hypothetical protein
VRICAANSSSDARDDELDCNFVTKAAEEEVVVVVVVVVVGALLLLRGELRGESVIGEVMGERPWGDGGGETTTDAEPKR